MANAFKLIGKLLKKNKKDEEEEETDSDISIGSTDSNPKWKVGDRATLKLDGIGDVVVPRGDMSEEEWNAFLADAKKKQKLRGETVVESVQDREAQKATGKSKFESRPKSDYMEVAVGKGRAETAVVPRGDMDQTSWEALKKRAQKMGVFRASNDTLKEKIKEGTGEVEKYAGPDAESTGMDADGIKPTKPTQTPEEEQRDLEDLQLQRGDTSGSHGVKRFVEGGLPATLGGRGGDVGTAQSIDEEPVAGAPKKGPRGNVEIGDAEVGTARTINRGVSKQMRMAGASADQQDAISRGLTKQVGDAGVAADQQRATVENALAPVRAAGDAALAAAGEPSPLTKDIMTGYAKPASDMMDTVGRGLQGVGHSLLPNTISAPTQPQGTMVPPPAPGAAGAPPDVTGLPPGSAGAPPPGAGGQPGGSMSMSMQRSGGNVPEAGMPDRTAEIDTAFSNAARAQMAQADLESTGLKQKAKMFDDGLNEQVRQQAKIADIQARVQKEREQPMKVYNQLLSELMQPTQKIDPHRWWNSRSGGQKIMLALGALLTKGGNMRMIQSAIDSDISAQQMDLQNNRDRQRTALGAADNLIGMIRQNGADDVQAAKIATALSWDMVSKRLEMVAANTDSQTIKLKAEQNIAESNVKRNQILTEMDKYSADLAIRKAHLANESEMISIKRQKAGAPKGKKLEHLKGPQVTKIAAMQNALAKMEELERTFSANNSGFLESGVNTLAKQFPTTKSSRFDFDADINIANIGDSLGNAGVMQKADVERWKAIHPQSNDPDGMRKLGSMKADIQRRLAKELEAFKAAGYDVEGLDAGGDPSTFTPDEEQ